MSLYALTTGLRDPAEFLPFVRMIQAMDHTFLDYLRKKHEAEKGKDRPRDG